MQYSKFVKPAFDDFILPTKKYADIIVPYGGDNHVAVNLIVQHIHTKLGQHTLCKIYPSVYVIQSTFQVTIYVDESTLFKETNISSSFFFFFIFLKLNIYLSCTVFKYVNVSLPVYLALLLISCRSVECIH